MTEGQAKGCIVAKGWEEGHVAAGVPEGGHVAAGVPKGGHVALDLPVVQRGKSGRRSPCSLRIQYANNLGNQLGMDLFDVWGSSFS